MGAPAAVTAGATPRASRAPFRRGLEAFGTAAVLAGVLVLAAVGAFLLTGHALTVDRGDIVVTGVAPARDVRAGDVITFPDPRRGGRTVTHRVLAVQPGAPFELRTRDVGSGATQKWSIASGGEIGRRVLVVPGTARVIDGLTGAPALIALALLSLLCAAAFAVRRLRAGARV